MSRDPTSIVPMPLFCILGKNDMAAIEGDRVQFLRSYCDLLSAENKNNKKNCERLKHSAGLDPYSVSANFFFRSMDKWPEVKFPDMVKEHFKAYKCLQSYQNFVVDCVRSILWERRPQIINALPDDGSKKKINLQNSASSRLVSFKLRL